MAYPCKAMVGSVLASGKPTGAQRSAALADPPVVTVIADWLGASHGLVAVVQAGGFAFTSCVGMVRPLVFRSHERWPKSAVSIA